MEIAPGDAGLLHGHGIVAEVSSTPLALPSNHGVAAAQRIVRRVAVSTAAASSLKSPARAETVPIATDATADAAAQRSGTRECSGGGLVRDGRDVDPEVIRDSRDPLCAISSYGTQHAPEATHALFDEARNQEATLFARRRILQPSSELIPSHEPSAVRLLHYGAGEMPKRRQGSSERTDGPSASCAAAAPPPARLPSPRFQPPHNVAEVFPRRLPPPVPDANDTPLAGGSQSSATAIPVRQSSANEVLREAAAVLSAGLPPPPQKPPVDAGKIDLLLSGAIMRQQRHQLFEVSTAASSNVSGLGRHGGGELRATAPPWSTNADLDEDDILAQWKASLSNLTGAE